jgi:hypothetical protein
MGTEDGVVWFLRVVERDLGSVRVLMLEGVPHIRGGKKLVYVQIDMPMTALDELYKLGDRDPRYLELDDIVKQHNGLWSGEAEEYLLNMFRK